MPLCHHLIEGIKMRTIPISNYANLHRPFISENDYIYFNNYETLNESILKALNMSDEEIKSRQDNLEKFYNLRAENIDKEIFFELSNVL